MSLGVLNNISAIYAQNNLNHTQSALNTTLQQLSSGSRINSGADDAAGLSLANGLQASSTALSQSASNATEGVDFLQTADGALAQVTGLLNRAVTLATEASNGTLNSTQQAATQAEYSSIMGEINTIGSNTEYNGINVFKNGANVFTSDGTTSQTYATSALAASGFGVASIGLNETVMVGTAAAAAASGTDANGNKEVAGDILFTDTATSKVYDLTAMRDSTAAATDTEVLIAGNTAIAGTASTAGATSPNTDVTGAKITSGDNLFTTGSGTVIDIGTGAAADLSFNTDLSSMAGAENALTAITVAITAVAADRGTLGANINTLTAVENVQSTQSTNTLSAENDVTATDYGTATSNMSKQQILMQTGIAALAQANQSQQLITKLLQ